MSALVRRNGAADATRTSTKPALRPAARTRSTRSTTSRGYPRDAPHLSQRGQEIAPLEGGHGPQRGRVEGDRRIAGERGDEAVVAMRGGVHHTTVAAEDQPAVVHGGSSFARLRLLPT